MANAGFYARRIDSVSDCVALTAWMDTNSGDAADGALHSHFCSRAPQSNWKTQVELIRVKLIYQSTAQQFNQPSAIMKMQFIQRCVVVLAMVAVSAQAQGGRNNNQVPVNNVQWTQPQGNAQVQPFVGEQRSGFVNDVNNNNAAEANVNANANPQNSQQLTISDFQNAGFSAEDAQRIVANLSVGNNRDAVVVQPTSASVTSTATISTAAAPVVPAAPTSVSTTPSQPAAAVPPVAAEGSSVSTTTAATPAVTTSVPTVTTSAPAVTTPITTAPPKLTMSPAAAEASTPAPPAATPTATTIKSAVTAFSADLETPEGSSSSAASKGAGVATWLAGGVGCVLAVAAMAALYRRKTMRPKTPGTPAEQKATYFHCEARLTPPVYIV